MPGPLGLLHPFPSALNALAAATFTLLAGGSAATAGGAALAMALLQTSIGSVNDLCDLERDRLGHPEKPLPSGRVGRGVATGYGPTRQPPCRRVSASTEWAGRAM